MVQLELSRRPVLLAPHYISGMYKKGKSTQKIRRFKNVYFNYEYDHQVVSARDVESPSERRKSASDRMSDEWRK
jgi:hypothetical protein